MNEGNQPVEVDVDGIKFYDNQGNELNPDGTKKDKSKDDKSKDSTGNGILSSIFGAIPGILSSLFPTGVKGNNNNTPIMTTLPPGTQSVSVAGSNNMMMIILILMVGFLIFTGMNPVQKVKK